MFDLNGLLNIILLKKRYNLNNNELSKNPYPFFMEFAPTVKTIENSHFFINLNIEAKYWLLKLATFQNC